MARFFIYSTEEAVAALKEAHIPYRVHGECCISVNNNDYSAAVEAFFRNNVSFQPEQQKRCFLLQPLRRESPLREGWECVNPKGQVYLTKKVSKEYKG